MNIFKKVKDLIQIVNAYRLYIDNKFNVKCVIINGKYKVIERNCGTCRHQETDHSKYCTYLSSVGCDDHLEIDNNKRR